MKKESQRNPHGPVGIALEHRELCVVELRPGKRSAAVVRAVRRELPECDRSTSAWHEAVANALRDAAPDLVDSGASVVTMMPPEAVEYRHFKLAPMPDGDLPEAVYWKATHGVREPHRADYYDFAPAAHASGAHREVIAVTASETFLEEHVDAIQSIGVEIHAIDTSAGATARCLSDHDGPLTLIDLSRGGSTLVVCSHGEPRFVRPLSVDVSRLPSAAGAAALAGEIAHETSLCAHYLAEQAPDDLQPRHGCILGAGPSEASILEEVNRSTSIRFRSLDDALAGAARVMIQSIDDADASRYLHALGLALYEREFLCGSTAA